jgi:hypothetical protein
LRAQFISAISIISKNPALSNQVNPVELLKVLFKMFPELKEMELIAQDPAKQLQALLEKLELPQLTMVLNYINQLIPAKTANPGLGKPAGTSGGSPQVPVSGQNLGKTGAMVPQIPGAGTRVNAPGSSGARLF